MGLHFFNSAVIANSKMDYLTLKFNHRAVTVCPRHHFSVNITGFVYTSLSKFVDPLQALVHA